jgi:tryptophanyl-tRNA synthetase
MNSTYGTDFPEPTRFATKGEYIPSLTGEGKMSKSVEGSFINLTDDLTTIRQRLAQAPTDSGKGEKIPERGGVTNLLILVELFEGKEKREKYEKMYLGEGIHYSELKEELAKAIFEELKPIQERRKKFEENPALVEKILAEGREKARKVAASILVETKEAMGLI